MAAKNRSIFLDTSVIFAAVLSETGGARKLFRLGEAGVIQLIVGPNVLRECEGVVRRKAPRSLPTLAYLLELGRIEPASQPEEETLELAAALVEVQPDAVVLAEAMGAEPDWTISHDQSHFLKANPGIKCPFRIGTPGDLIQALAEEFSAPC
jgi:predicted nucleic acid-binding protein